MATVLFAFGRPDVGASAGPDGDVQLLEPGKPVEREIARGETHSYQIRVEAGQYAHVVVDQRGIDLVLILVEPDGNKSPEIDSPNGWWGIEEICVIAPASGTYVVQVRSLDKEVAPGRYEAKVDALRAATALDEQRAEAQKTYAEAEQLRGEQTAESLRRAIKRYERAASLRRGADDLHGEAVALMAAGETCSGLGEYQRASDYFGRALPTFRVSGGGELAGALDFSAPVLMRLGDTQKAFRYSEEALSIWRAIGDRAGEAYNLANMGLAYYLLGENRRALDYFAQALPLARAAGDRVRQAVILHGLGVSWYVSGDNRKALDFLNESLLLRRALATKRGEGQTLNRIGVVYMASGDREKALDYFSQALSLQRTLGDRSWEADTLTHIGEVYASFGERQKAVDHFKLALAVEREIGDRAREAQTLSSIARVERDRGNLIEARRQVEAAFEIFDSLRSKIRDQDLRASYFASVRGSYDLYVDVLMRLHQREPSEGFDAQGLRANEAGRARGLLDALTEARADIRRGVDPSPLERERSLLELISSKSEIHVRLLSGKHTEEQAAAGAREIEALKTEYEQARAQIRAASPHYAALTQPEALGLNEIQKQVLDRETVLLEYAQGDERSHVWLVTSSSLKSFELPKRTEIEAAARQVYELLTARNRRVKFESEEVRRVRIKKTEAAYGKAAATLSQKVLGPVAGELGTKRLLIVADGALQYVPFAALPSPANQGGYVPLGAEHEIVSLPSASVLAVLRREIAGRAPPPKTVMILADPVFEKGDERLKGAGKAAAEGPSARTKPPSDSPLVRSAQDLGLEEGGQLRIPRLPFTRREAEAIFSLALATKRKEALDFDANRAAATSEDLGQYRFVHFATHGFLNSLHPELSGLVFSLVDREGKDQDGFLPALEVYNLKLPVDLVVLSGCRTGLGKDVKGEGLVGLTRGFMYAGAARVLVSLWDVDDEATAELMTRFYQGMLGKQRLAPSAALRAAQTSLSKEKRWQAPYYWAGFILQGEPN